MRFVFVIALLFLVQASSFGSTKSSMTFDNNGSTNLKILEDSIQTLANKLYEYRRKDNEAKQLSSQISNLIVKALNTPGAEKHPFDSVFPITKVSSERGNVKIFTWNIVHRDGTHTHYGIVNYINKNINKIYKLEDKTYEIENLTKSVLNHEKWYGAIYYDIIEEKNSTGTHYVLLGWHGNNLSSNKKVIETMYFTESGKVKFGKTLLSAGKKKYKRIIFEYSRMADMMLYYNKEMDMIIFDHLSPIDPLHSGNFQFYGPDLSYDALKFNGDYWEYNETIDFKRPKEKKSRRQ